MKKFKVDTSVSLILKEEEKQNFKPQMIHFDSSNYNQMQYNLNRLVDELEKTGRLQIPIRGKAHPTKVDIYQSLYFKIQNVPTQSVVSMNTETGYYQTREVESHDRVLVWDEYHTHPAVGIDTKRTLEDTLSKWKIKTF